MYLIVGLGNPGNKYEHTRHNIGFLVLDHLAQEHGMSFRNKRAVQSDLAEGMIGEKRVLLCKPQTFMNASGKAVTDIMKKYPVKPENVIVVYDDADLGFGDLREKIGGSSAGHRGVESLLTTCGNDAKQFSRLRFGIGRPSHPDIQLEDFVLQKWSSSEQEALKTLIPQAAERVIAFTQKV